MVEQQEAVLDRNYAIVDALETSISWHAENWRNAHIQQQEPSAWPVKNSSLEKGELLLSVFAEVGRVIVAVFLRPGAYNSGSSEQISPTEVKTAGLTETDTRGLQLCLATPDLRSNVRLDRGQYNPQDGFCAYARPVWRRNHQRSVPRVRSSTCRCQTFVSYTRTRCPTSDP